MLVLLFFGFKGFKTFSGSLAGCFQFKPEEIAGIMKDFDQPGHLAPTGLHLGGTKYMVIQGEAGAVIRGKKVIYILYMYSALTWNGIFSIVEPVIHFYYPLIFIINVFFISQKEDYAFLKVYPQHGTFCKCFFFFFKKNHAHSTPE